MTCATAGVNVETFVTAITNHKAALKLPDVPHPLVTTTSAHLQVDALGFTLLPTLLPAAVLHPVHKSQWPVRVTRRHTEHLTRQQSSNLLNLRLVQVSTNHSHSCSPNNESHLDTSSLLHRSAPSSGT